MPDKLVSFIFRRKMPHIFATLRHTAASLFVSPEQNRSVNRFLTSGANTLSETRTKVALDDSKDGRLRIHNVKKDLDERCLKIFWSNGRTSRYPYIFLRDNCKCPECSDDSSKQKLFDAVKEVGLGIEAKEASIPEDGSCLRCVWPGGHESQYQVAWLWEKRMPKDGDAVLKSNSDKFIKDELVLWERETMQEKIPSLSYDAIMNDDQSLFDCLYNLYQYGIVLLSNAPAREGIVNKIGDRIGYLKRTFYGDTFDVKEINDPSNLAYTSKPLYFHTDLPYLTSPPHIQLLHCINQNVTGGWTTFVDGFHVVKQLKKINPEAFDILRAFPVRYRNEGTDIFGENLLGHSYPVINLNKFGRLEFIQYSTWTTSDFHGNSSPDEVLQFYDAFHSMTKLVYAGENVVDIHLQPGQVVLFHNTRLLHGRTAFEATGGLTRWLQGSYFDWDVIFSKLRVLHRRLDLKKPYLYEQSDDFF